MAVAMNSGGKLILKRASASRHPANGTTTTTLARHAKRRWWRSPRAGGESSFEPSNVSD